jgi:peptidoglycan/LPS O-acetylase OafA/YrhL
MTTAPINGFRGLAVLLVLAFHTAIFSGVMPPEPFGVIARTGNLGVDLFFVISGFCLFLPHARAALANEPPPTVWAFAIARAAKILPSYLITLGVVAIVAVSYLGPGEIATNLVAHLTFTQNAFVDGFGPTISVFWSLAIEVQFYVLFPLIAPVFRREPIVTAVAMTMTALAYRYAEAPCCVATESVMRELPSYLDLFAAGMLSAYLVALLQSRDDYAQRSARWAPWCAYLTIVQVFAIIGIMRSADMAAFGWFVAGRTWFGLAAASTMASACFSSPWLRRAIANPALSFVSVISYNVYLWHTIVLIWLRDHGIGGVAQIAIGWPVTFAISTAVTYLIERPILRRAKTWRPLIARKAVPT